MANHRLRILHISDLHERGTRENATWRRQRVLGPEWTANLAEIVKDGRIDLVCFTGDLADRGDKTEYNAATSFLDALLEALGLPRERFFAVPGNHDIARTVAKPEWDRLRQHHADMREIELSEWILGRANVPRGFSASDDAAILQREAAFWTWLCEDFGRAELHPSKSPHGRLGYRVQAQVGDLPFPVQIVGLDSAWAAGDNHDSQHLLLTSDQVGRLLTDNGSPLPGFRLGLVHHPLSQLADAADVTPQLANGLDLLLRGHQHREALEQWADPNFKLRMYATGCLYDGHDKDQWPNAFHVIDLQLDGSGRPLRGEVRFRGWSSTGHWHDDNSRYAGTHHGRLAMSWVPEVRHSVPPPPVFVGREHELAMLEATLLPGSGAPGVAAICAVQGMPGVGKSYLADEFATRHTQQFPGGYIRLVLGPADLRTADELIAALGQQLDPPFQGADVLVRLVYRLQHPRTLVHIENVDTQETAVEVAKVVRQLQHCCIVLSGRIANLGAGTGWLQIPLAAFDAATALLQLRQELGLVAGAPNPVGAEDLLDALGYLPLAIHLAASHLRDGATPRGFLARLRGTGLALAPRDAADRGLSIDESRAILSKTFELSLDAMRKEGGADGEKLIQAYAALAHAAPAGFGRSLGAAIAGLDEGEFELLMMAANRLSLLVKVEPSAQPDGAWRLHPLLADFLRPRVAGEQAVDRMTAWFCARLPQAESGHEADQGQRWAEVHSEAAGLVHWLPLVPGSDLAKVERAGSNYAIQCGPFRPWLTFSARVADPALHDLQRSDGLWTLGNLAFSVGDMDRALAAAATKRDLDAALGRERGVALGWGIEANVRQALGQVDEALRIRREIALPLFERLGDLRSIAVMVGKNADIMELRGDLDQALRVRREEQLPILHRVGAMREWTVTQGRIADILLGRGELDEALRIRREDQLPVFERMGDVRSKAMTMGQIADILLAQGQLDQALHIFRMDLVPVFEALGDEYGKAVTMGKIADILQTLGQADVALRIRLNDELPVHQRFGNRREVAVTKGKVACFLLGHGQAAEAIRMMREEVVPQFEELGYQRDLLFCRVDLALCLVTQGQPADRPEIAHLLTQAHVAAFAMRIPEADQIANLYVDFFGTPIPDPPPAPEPPSNPAD